MAVNVETETIYYVVCDGCNARAPADNDSRARAIFDAIKAGWHRLTKWSGTEYAHQDLCPTCFEAWEAEQPDGWNGWVEANVPRY